jgi:4-amino-4-deoxy-L-arabinose transferase-like glycosyltransferase
LITLPAPVGADEASAIADVPPAPAGAGPRRVRTTRLPLVAVTLSALALNVWRLSVNRLGNQYYAAATRSMAASWHNWFFAAFDSGGFISVDKPPIPLWITALSVRLFGPSTWSVLLPSALAGAGAVALLWCVVRRRFGVVAATIAGLVLALSPINVAVNRLNLPEPWLILFLVAAAWALLRSFDAERWVRWLLVSGAFVGLAFNTKMLAAYIPLTALGVALAAGTRGWVERGKRVAIFTGAAIATSLPWLLAVDLTPASARPYVGGSTNNSVWDLIFGYNGLGRVAGSGATGAAGRGGFAGGLMSGAGGIFGGTPGPFRLFSDAVGGQIAWLLPLAALGAVAGCGLHHRSRERRAQLALWIGWVLLFGVVFSYAKGTFHSYYTAVMTPGIAAIMGIGLASLVPLVRRDRAWLWAAGAGVVATVALQLRLSGRAPGFYHWTVWILGAAVAAAVAVVATSVSRRNGIRPLLAAGALVLGGALVAPTAWAVSETANPVLNATLPQAGPRTGAAGSSFGSASWNGDPGLAAFLKSRHTTETWDLVVASAQQASGLIAYDGLDVLALGGFMGTDPAASIDSVAAMVAAGQVRFFEITSGGFGGGTASQILTAVQTACAPVAAYSGSIYDCAGKASALIGA